MSGHADLAYVCSDCGAPLVRIESPDEPRLVSWSCPTHGDRGFFMLLGRLCAECYELIEPDESAVPSRVIEGAPLVHPECAGPDPRQLGADAVDRHADTLRRLADT